MDMREGSTRARVYSTPAIRGPIKVHQQRIMDLPRTIRWFVRHALQPTTTCTPTYLLTPLVQQAMACTLEHQDWHA